LPAADAGEADPPTGTVARNAGSNGCYLSVPLRRGGGRTAIGELHAEFASADAPATSLRSARIEAAARLLEQALETVRDFDALRESMVRLKQAERLQRAR
jgi:hypothetical protein